MRKGDDKQMKMREKHKRFSPEKMFLSAIVGFLLLGVKVEYLSETLSQHQVMIVLYISMRGLFLDCCCVSMGWHCLFPMVVISLRCFRDLPHFAIKLTVGLRFHARAGLGCS